MSLCRTNPRRVRFLVFASEDRIQEIALRVIVESPDAQAHVIGTAVVIGPYLALTAKHVLDDVTERFPSSDGYSLRLYQVLPLPKGPVYRIWGAVNTWVCESDIAIMHLGLDRTYGDTTSETAIAWKSLRLRVAPPPIGHIVLAFGYRESRITVSYEAGNHHIDLKDFGTTSGGKVGEIHHERRDASMPFPCFQVLARHAAGMSGGLVVDENYSLCGLICRGWDLAPDEPPLSYAATLWPILKTKISADRGDAYPRGVTYPVIDLVRDKFLHTVGLEELDPNLFPGRVAHPSTPPK